MGESTAAAGQLRAIRARIAEAGDHLTVAVENVLYDLGQVGHKAARDILSEISDELYDIEQLAGGGDDG